MAKAERPSNIELAVFILCLLPYFGFWLYGLTDLDEGFYGAVTTDMLRLKDWITPTYNGVPWFEKPILSYWLSMPFLALAPSNEFAARLPSFLCTIGTTLVLFKFAKQHFDIQTARLTAIIFSTSLLVVAVGRMMMTDAPLVLCLTLAFTTFFDSLVENPKKRLWTAFFLGLAMLAKGPVGPVLFLIVAALTYWRLPDLRPKFKGHWHLGIAILLVTVATWYVPAYLANGQTFIQDFIITQNLNRFKGGDTAHGVPWYLNLVFFPLVIALSMAPWLASAHKSGWHKTKTGTGLPRQLRVYFWIIAFTIIGFFTISQTKLVHYVLPAIPALALLAAEAIAHRHPARKPEIFWIKVAVPVSIITFIAANVIFHLEHQNRYQFIQAAAKYAQKENLDLIILGLGRQQDKDPEIKLQRDQTSHPSLLFYFRQPAQMTNNLPPQEPNQLIITRQNLTLPNSTKLTPRDFNLPEDTKTAGYTILKTN